MTIPVTVLDRFIRYVQVDTRADERSSTYPSTAGQRVLLGQLADELRALGLQDVHMDEFGYVTATVPATTAKPDVPTIGFIAHVDTSPELTGADVRPIVHRAYDGRDLVLPDDPRAVIRLADNPDLADQMGHDIVTASGTTLLGADDKAGVAAIVTAAAYLAAHPEIPHGRIRIAFTPDEEIGRGTLHFDVAAFGAFCAYTLDGGTRGEVEAESFAADAMTVTFVGFNTHPGYAKGRLVNAIKVAAAFVASLPAGGLSPETTEGHEGFVHPYTMSAAVEQTSVRLIIRDFTVAGLQEKERQVEALARAAADAFPGARLEVTIEEQYRNMKEVLDQHPTVVANAIEAVRRAGLPVLTRSIRGGTDGSRLSFMGLPTPNLFAGEHNFHSRLEWVSVQDMEKAVETIVHLCRIWEERA
ncbi:MAG: peptidase T [Vicinamibacterales bacterium]